MLLWVIFMLTRVEYFLTSYTNHTPNTDLHPDRTAYPNTNLKGPGMGSPNQSILDADVSNLPIM